MKNNYLIWSLMMVMIPSTLFGQINGKVDYKVILEGHEFKELQGTLYFDDLESYFFVDMESESPPENQNEEFQLVDDKNVKFEFDFTLNRPTRYEVYIDRDTKTILSQRSVFKNLVTKPCVVFEETDLIEWEIGEETKQIGSFSAQKATTSFRGRNYVVWFTPDIPVGIGPWKFHGLPGLILEVQDDELGVQFLFTSIQIPFDSKPRIIQPSDGDLLPLNEFIIYHKNFSKELINSIRAKLPREATISKISLKEVVKSIEREY